LYSFATVDISEPAAITIPEHGERYVSVMVVNEDHYINGIFHDAGTHEIGIDRFDTPYVAVAVRILVDPTDPDDVTEVHRIQNGFQLDASAARPFEMPDYDHAELDTTRQALLTLASQMKACDHTFGSRADVNPVHHLIGTAAGWGGLPDAEATYVGDTPDSRSGAMSYASTTSPSTRSGRSPCTTRRAISNRTRPASTASTASPACATRMAASPSASATTQTGPTPFPSPTDGTTWCALPPPPRDPQRQLDVPDHHHALTARSERHVRAHTSSIAGRTAHPCRTIRCLPSRALPNRRHRSVLPRFPSRDAEATHIAAHKNVRDVAGDHAVRPFHTHAVITIAPSWLGRMGSATAMTVGTCDGSLTTTTW
jgi:hypothetical protein